MPLTNVPVRRMFGKLTRLVPIPSPAGRIQRSSRQALLSSQPIQEMLKMKLAELLKVRSGLQNKAEDLTKRIYANVKRVDGDTPPEDPEALLVELDATFAELEGVVLRINTINSTQPHEGDSLLTLLLRREMTGKRLHTRKQAAETAAKHDHFRDSDALYRRHVDVGKLYQEADTLAKQYRELDNRIQELNWTITVED